MFAPLFAAAVALAPANLNCADEAAVQAAWTPGIQAFQAGDVAGARSNVDSIIARCGEAQNGWHPRVMRALIDLQEKKPADAVAVLSPVPRPGPGAIGAFPNYIALAAYAGLNDAPAFERERDLLLAASARAITDRRGEIRGKAVETFTTAAGEVQAFEARFTQGQLRRSYVFLVKLAQPFASPMSLMLTSNLALDQMARSQGEPPPVILDQYTCAGHSTLTMVSKTPTYPELRKLVVDSVEGRLTPVSSSTGRGDGVCNMRAFVTPGLAG